jgi:hypothetical protein
MKPSQDIISLNLHHCKDDLHGEGLHILARMIARAILANRLPCHTDNHETENQNHLPQRNSDENLP